MSDGLMNRKPVFDRTEQVLFFLYLFATLFLVFCHEPWEDELQVWCIAQELSIPEIFHQMRYEGHFCIVVSAADHVIFKVARKND